MASQHESGLSVDPIPIGVETTMASQQENLLDIDPNPVGVETQEAQTENFATLGSVVPIEEGVEKINLLDSSHSFSIEEKGDKDDSGSDSDSESGDKDDSGSDSDSDSESGSDSDSESGSESESESENSGSESSDSGSESSSTSDSEEESDDGDDDDENEVQVEEGEISSDEEKVASWSMVDDDADRDDEDGDAGVGPIRSKNELQNLPVVPPVNAALEPHHQTLPVGIITSILGAQVIVEGVEKHDPLNEGSILWLTESRKPLGLIDEIFGPVKNPFYIVRYNSESEVPEGINGGTLISFVPEFAEHVLNNKDLYRKGYDASGANDEELSDEMEFSDDEKEAEYKRTQRTTKRGVNDQNHGKKKNNRKKFSPKEHAAPSMPDAPAAPLVSNGNCPPFQGIGQALLGGTATVSSFPYSNAAPPNFATHGIWTQGTFPQQPQNAMFPNGFPANGLSWLPQNTQIPPQLPMPGIPFQQQVHGNQGSLSSTMLPGMQPNMFAQSIYAAGLVGQNQMTFGMGSPFPQIQPPVQQGFPSNSGAPPQFHARPSGNRGRKRFHGGRKGWRPTK